MSEEVATVRADEQQQSTSIFSTIKKIYTNITVEPLVVCWLLPFLMTYAAIENMNFEMACRELVTPETGYEKDICKLFVRKDEFGINCQPPADDKNNATMQFDDVKNDAIKERFPEIYASIENQLTNVYQFLCDAEDQVQNKLSTINSIRNPISSFGPLIIIIFAGPYSDKKNLRVPCMLVPYIGEALGYFTLFIASIFINGPVEFPAYAYRLLPSLTGAENLMVMGIFSYLTAVSSDENRTFRFGMFQILMTIVPIFAQSISPFLIKRWDYTQLFAAMIPVHVIGFLYAIFYLKEVKIEKKEDKKENAAYDNPTMTTTDEMISTNENIQSFEELTTETVVKSKNACLEFFDPQLATYCIRSFLKKRENGLRTIIILFMLMHFVMNGITQGETQNLFLYGRAKLGWDVDKYVYYNVFTIIAGLIGTSIAVGLLSKILKVADIFLVLISTAMSLICRGVYVFASSTVMFFSGTAIDFMYSVKLLGVRSIISKIVPTDDLSTMFALMGLFEALSGFFFPYIYPTFYQFLLKNPNYDVSYMFILSGVLFAFAFIVYIIIWKLLKRKEDAEAVNNEEKSPQMEDTKF
ncbi:hypothetical protein PVAND_006068 [Polypedilum vanderplanki]|uniref:Uncharacterized protein n=1 Tax=Polypedilum vanderplanki TaxID=319348 RepID=A0A9J6C326_POLVA|nr:hypothetical protein PVAND_006068 [Polypedilum vanderplanki]